MKSTLLAFTSLLTLFPLNLFALEEADLKDDKGQLVVHYAIETPKVMAPADTTVPSKQLGLFVCFHEHNGKAPDETHSVIDSLKRLKLSDEYVVIGMQDGTSHGYSPVEDHERADKLIAWAKKTYPINPRRVYLWGRGEGAKMVGEFGAEHADIVAGIITYSWGFRKTYDVKNPELNIPDFYIVLGLSDLATHLRWVRATYVLALAHGYNVIYREAEGLRGTTKHLPTNDDAILWATKMRHKTMAPSAQEMALIKPYASASAALSLEPDSAAFAALTLVGGRQAGAVLAPIFEAKNERTRIKAAEICETGNFGPEAAVALAKRLNDSSGEVRRAVIRALGVQANWRLLPAQDALCQVAIDKHWDTDERSLALDAIGVAVKLQVKGFYQDLPLFKALITVLDDDDAGLRARAYSILSPITASTYQPEAAKADRQAAIVQWQEWLENVSSRKELQPAPRAQTNSK
jgi:hypothetical protein